jgi:NAD(P)-dependent dehydrogenase (short-subunit alcohol dehydrogenase family)
MTRYTLALLAIWLSWIPLPALSADAPIDILLNNAGMLGDEQEQRLGSLDPARFDTYMRVNATYSMN